MKPPFEYKQMVLSRDSFGAASNGSVLAEAEERAAAEVAYSGECFPRTQLGSPETCVCVCVCAAPMLEDRSRASSCPLPGRASASGALASARTRTQTCMECIQGRSWARSTGCGEGWRCNDRPYSSYATMHVPTRSSLPCARCANVTRFRGRLLAQPVVWGVARARRVVAEVAAGYFG